VSPMNNLEKDAKKFKSSRKTSGLVELALKLYRAGFNVIPVDSEKKPLCSWSPRERIEESKLKELLAKASGIAICGGPENPFKVAKSILVIFDIDDPRILEKASSSRVQLKKPSDGALGLDALNAAVNT